MMFYEIRKIISKRGLILWGFFLLLSSLIIPMYHTYTYRKTNAKYYQNMETLYQEVWDDYKGKGSVRRISRKLEEEGIRGLNALNDYMFYLCKKSARETGKSTHYYFDFGMENHSLLGIEKALSKMEDTQSYEYQNKLREKNMMESCNLEYINTHFWTRYNAYETVIVIIIFLFMIFILAGIYTKERSDNMNYILCTAKISKLRIIMDKWLAGCLLGISSIIIINLNLMIALIFYGGNWGYNADIVNLDTGFVYSPYNIEIWQYMLLKIVFQSIGMVFIVVFVEYMSLRSEYRYPIVLYGSLLFFPQFISYLVILNREVYKIIDILYDWSLLAAVHPEHAFYKYHTFNIVGISVDYNVVYILLMISLIVFIGMLTMKKYHRYIVEVNRRRKI